MVAAITPTPLRSSFATRCCSRVELHMLQHRIGIGIDWDPRWRLWCLFLLFLRLMWSRFPIVRCSRSLLIHPSNLCFQVIDVLRRDSFVIPRPHQLQNILGGHSCPESLTCLFHRFCRQLSLAWVWSWTIWRRVTWVFCVHHSHDPGPASRALSPCFPCTPYQAPCSILPHPSLVRQVPVVDILPTPITAYICDPAFVVITRRHAGVAMPLGVVLAGFHEAGEVGKFAAGWRRRHTVIGVRLICGETRCRRVRGVRAHRDELGVDGLIVGRERWGRRRVDMVFLKIVHRTLHQEALQLGSRWMIGLRQGEESRDEVGIDIKRFRVRMNSFRSGQATGCSAVKYVRWWLMLDFVLKLVVLYYGYGLVYYIQIPSQVINILSAFIRTAKCPTPQPTLNRVHTYFEVSNCFALY